MRSAAKKKKMIWGLAAVLVMTRIGGGLWSGLESAEPVGCSSMDCFTGKADVEDHSWLHQHFNRKLLQLEKGEQEAHRIIMGAIRDGKVDEYIKEGRTTPLGAAVQAERADLIAQIVQVGGDVEKETRKGTGITPLMVAASEGSVPMVEELLKHGANIDAVNDKGRTALWRAAYDGELDMVQYLVGQNAAMDIQDHSGYTALLAAVQKSFLKVAKFLIDSKADVNLATTRRGQSPLWMATFLENVEIMEALLVAGADADKASKNGVFPLLLAVHKNCNECAVLLLEHGANPNAADGNKWTPLHEAAAKGYVGLLDTLLRFGADKNVQDAFLHKPVHTIGRSNGNMDWELHQSIHRTLTSDPVPEGFALVREGTCEGNNLNSSDRHGKQLSLDACARACKDHVRCAAFVHHKREICYLKHETCLNPDTSQPFYLTYDKVPQGYQRVKGNCRESDTTLSVNTRSLQDCADICDQQNCDGFVYTDEEMCDTRKECTVSEAVSWEGYIMMKAGEAPFLSVPPEEASTTEKNAKRPGFVRVRGAYLHIGWVIALPVVVAAVVGMQVVCIRVHRQTSQRSPTPGTDALSGGRTPNLEGTSCLCVSVPCRRSTPEITPTEPEDATAGEESGPSHVSREGYHQNAPSPPMEASPFASMELHKNATIKI